MGGALSGSVMYACAGAWKVRSGWRMLAAATSMCTGALTVGPLFAATALCLPLHNYSQMKEMHTAYWIVPWGGACQYAAYRAFKAQPLAFSTSAALGLMISPSAIPIFTRVFIAVCMSLLNPDRK
ncbi:hypothetical protein DFH09DRAFT_1363915 [Mycena vulgaris]|nr:hypothetical protein DFH09DRAFT_1363915 [Mycena vulgaris]